MEKIIIFSFTDPMMGLSYESEPVFRKLETHFAGHIEFRYIMSGLVRNVTDFMTPEDITGALPEYMKAKKQSAGCPWTCGGFTFSMRATALLCR